MTINTHRCNVSDVLPCPLDLLCSLLVVSLVRRDAGNDGRCAITPARNGAESPDEEDLPVRDNSPPVDTDFAGCVSGDHEQRALVLRPQRASSCSRWHGEAHTHTRSLCVIFPGNISVIFPAGLDYSRILCTYNSPFAHTCIFRLNGRIRTPDPISTMVRVCFGLRRGRTAGGAYFRSLPLTRPATSGPLSSCRTTVM